MTSPDAVGLSNPKLLNQQNRQELLRVLNNLHSSGVQADISEIPQIVVVGSQSSGKSSLIESISGISLPRGTGTCTRCPIECLCKKTDIGDFECRVSIRYYRDRNGNPLPRPLTTQVGEVIANELEVEARIAQAQQEILSGPEGQECLEYSEDCIVIDIRSPRVADLAFCDLPGLVANVGGKNKYGQFVEDLVRSYIQRPSCIVLVSVNCETDFETQGAQDLVKEYDPEGKRTIGVLTKPDRIEEEDVGRWHQDFLFSNRAPSVSCWFVVKQPNIAERAKKLTWEDARRQESEFFQTRGTWASLSPLYRGRLGTSKLVEYLSVLLSSLILDRLPKIGTQIDASISETNAALSQLPPPPSTDPRRQVDNVLHTFEEELRRRVQGVSRGDLLQTIQICRGKFRDNVRATAPNFRPFESRYEGLLHLRPAAFLVSEEGSAFEQEYSDEEPDSNATTFAASRQSVGNATQARSSGRAKKRKEPPRNRIYTEEVSAEVASHRGWEFSAFVPFSAIREYCLRPIAGWKEITYKFLNDVFEQVSRHVQDLVGKHFSLFGQGKLAKKVGGLMHQHLRQLRLRAEGHLETVFLIESETSDAVPYHLERYRRDFLNHYNQARQQSGLYGHSQPSDDSIPAVQVMAWARAYFQVAYLRFVSNVPPIIEGTLVRGAANDLYGMLFEGLQLKDPTVCKEYAQENVQVATKRLDLTNKLKRLNEANADLEKLRSSIN